MDVIGSLLELAGRYDAVLCERLGRSTNGRRVFPGAGDVLIGLRAAGVRVVLLTNVPRPSGTMPRALARLGFPGGVGRGRDQWGRDPQ